MLNCGYDYGRDCEIWKLKERPLRCIHLALFFDGMATNKHRNSLG